MKAVNDLWKKSNHLCMKAFLTILFLLPGTLFAQSWQKIIQGDLNEIPTSLYALPDGGYMYSIVRNVSNGYTQISSQSVLVRTDNLGNTIWTHSAASANENFAPVVLKNGETMCVKFEDGMLIQKINPQGQTDGKGFYPYKENDMVLCEEALRDGGLLVFGINNFYSSSPPLFLTKIDSKGKVVWRQTQEFGYIHQHINHADLAEDRSGNILLAFSHFENDSPSVAEFARFDENGHLLKRVIVGTPGTKLVALNCLPDGKYILAGVQSGKNFIAQYVADDTLEWFKNPDGMRTNVERMAINEKGIIALMSHFLGTVVFCNNQGDVIAEKRIMLGHDTRGCHLISTLDGGFLIAGFTSPNTQNGSDIYLMKFNPDDWSKASLNTSDGDEVPGEILAFVNEIFPAPEILKPDIRVTAFPNPFQNNLTLQIENGEQIADGEVVIVSSAGSIVHRQSFTGFVVEINFSHLSSGAYFYSIIQQGRKIAGGKVVKIE